MSQADKARYLTERITNIIFKFVFDIMTIDVRNKCKLDIDALMNNECDSSTGWNYYNHETLSGEAVVSIDGIIFTIEVKCP